MLVILVHLPPTVAQSNTKQHASMLHEPECKISSGYSHEFTVCLEIKSFRSFYTDVDPLPNRRVSYARILLCFRILESLARRVQV